MSKLLLVSFILFLPVRTLAFEYDVDFPRSQNSKYQTVRVEVDGCNTLMQIEKKDLEAFKNNKDAIHQLIKVAIARSRQGCR